MSSTGLKKVLISSASSKISLIRLVEDCISSSPELGLLAGDTDNLALSSFFGCEFWAMPETIDDKFAEILQGCLDRNVGLVIPTRDGELIFWAENRTRFENHGIKVAVSAPDAVKTCLDKLKFSEWGIGRGLPFIPSFLSISAIESEGVVLKERFGSGSVGLYINRPRNELKELSEKLESPIFQPFIFGPEISVDAWLNSHGEVHGFVLRRRDVVRNGESQVTTTFRSVENEPEINEILSALGRDLGIRGAIVMQAILHQGRLSIIEVNARSGGASSASAQVGLNPLSCSIQEAFWGTKAVARFERANVEVRQVRGPADTHTILP